MTCSSGLCRCSSFQYYDYTALNCVNQKSINQTCNIDYNCRVDQGLQCVSGICQCVSAIPTWFSSTSKCTKLGNYSDTCTTTSECDTSLGLICNSGGSACNCPFFTR